MRNSILALFAVVAFVCSPPAFAAVKLDGDGIRDKIVGNTIQLVNENLELAIGAVLKDGSLRGSIGGKKISGTWSIKNNSELCFDLPNRNFDLCRVVFDHGSYFMLRNTAGNPSGRMEVLNGNPYNF